VNTVKIYYVLGQVIAVDTCDFCFVIGCVCDIRSVDGRDLSQMRLAI
jgi:hypothetical protein